MSDVFVHEIDPSVFAPLNGATADYQTEGSEQTRTCRRCGVSETVRAEGKGKDRRFPGLLAFERDHGKCKPKGGSR